MNEVADKGFIVPVEVQAFCVGTIDANDPKGTRTFAGATADFTDQAGGYDAFLGSNIFRAYTEAPWQQMEPGIHVHWAIPEALANGVQNQDHGGIEFPATANRWLVSRVVVDANGGVSRKSWVIESDVLQHQPTEGLKCVTLPVTAQHTDDPNFRYVGNRAEYDAQWRNPDTSQFKTLTGNELTSVANGGVDFAAFYPNCRNVFGVYDDLSDLTIPIDDQVELFYQVCGWYDNAENDPLHDGLTATQIAEQYHWVLSQETDDTFNFSLFNGLIQGIRWSPDTSYVVGSTNQQPIAADVALGNNPQEALAALFTNKFNDGNALFETMLDAFQSGLINQFQQPNANVLAQIQEILHHDRFASYDAGTRYTVVRKTGDDTTEAVQQLPLNLAAQLNELNLLQEELDFQQQYATEFKWQLFADWYRLMVVSGTQSDPEIQNLLARTILDKIKKDGQWEQFLATHAATEATFQQQHQQVSTVVASLGQEATLKTTAAERYWQANQPVFILSGDAINHHGTYRPNHNDPSLNLTCRTSAEAITAIEINGTRYDQSLFAAIDLAANTAVPQLSIINQCLIEACLLNPNLMAAHSQVAASEIQDDLIKALQHESQNLLAFTGTLPAMLAVSWWPENPWNAVFVGWEVKFIPYLDTTQNGQMIDYEADYFTSQFAVEQDQGGQIKYTGDINPNGLDFDQAQIYRGQSVLSDGSAVGFKKQLNSYLADQSDPALEQILSDLEQNAYPSQSLGGLNELLMMRDQSIQASIKAEPNNTYFSYTEEVAAIIGPEGMVESPEPNGHFNPIRAGYMQLELTLLNRYGQKRSVNIDQFVCAESMRVEAQGQTVPDVAYLPPRMSQHSRLVFRWLSASSVPLEEMNIHPASSPICGWILPNHLNGSLFIYNSIGKALGSLYLNGNGSQVLWQSAPGDNHTIGRDVDDVLAYENAELAGFTLALAHATPQFFQAFWRAVDTMHNFINPDNYAQAANLEVLIGRPMALAQATLGINQEGGPCMNQAWQALKEDRIDYDNRYTEVEFPVILGDLNRLNDGLIGYFKNDQQSTDFSHFYIESADGHDPGVLKPGPANVTLKPSLKFDPFQPGAGQEYATKLLMLIDPRATIHATTGVFPIKGINIPYDMYADVISTLETTFFTAPVLQGAAGLSMPTPHEAGFQWSWISQQMHEQQPQWDTQANITASHGQAMSAYSPQHLVEGWLRLNPDLLSVVLQNAQGQQQAVAGQVNELQLHMVNNKKAPIVFNPGAMVNEGNANDGSVLYLHLGRLVDEADVPELSISANGWTFQALNDNKYQNYWVATPSAPVTLAPNETMTFQLTNVKVTQLTALITLNFDYYGIVGINNGVTTNTISTTN